MCKPNRKEVRKIYRLSLAENDGKNKIFTIKFTKSNFIVTASAAAVLLLTLIYLLFAYTPLRSTIPGYPDEYSRMTAINNAVKIDSLESVITKWEIYSENLRRVLAGEETLQMDSLLKSDGANYLSDKSFEELKEK